MSFFGLTAIPSLAFIGLLGKSFFSKPIKANSCHKSPEAIY
ncbi:hypothetical protein NU09_0019 [Flavobacterium beibuense]|uniref:Uncharacterized protein n=1 Tax=Flavobacterium beibuense TaxID=657326 RepID=A0A444WHZ3_9FLAO|nr:hypothetical protein NU09_0019 [Flavobacterium beibuense]